MVLLINAISIKEGGSLVVFRYLLREFASLRPDIEWHVAVNDHLDDLPELSLPNVTAHVFHDTEKSPFHVKWWYEITLPRLAGSLKADAVFSQTNYLPYSPLGCPSLLLVQHAGHFSAVFEMKMRRKLSFLGKLAWKAKKKWVVNSLKTADKITVQTNALAEAILESTPIPAGKIAVIAHGPGLAQFGREIRACPQGRTWRIGYVTKFGVQKNFEVVIAAIRMLVDQGIDVSLELTLDPRLPECREVLALIAAAGMAAVVCNHGDLSADRVRALYESLDIFVFPSLCESFGFPLLEAMPYALPLLVADTQSNIEIIGDRSYVFAAEDPQCLARMIRELMRPEKYREASNYVLERVKCFSWSKAADETLQLLTGLAESRRIRSSN